MKVAKKRRWKLSRTCLNGTVGCSHGDHPMPGLRAVPVGAKIVLDAYRDVLVADSALSRGEAFAARQWPQVAQSVVVSDQSVLLTATTVTDGTESSRLEPSRQRAEAVKAILVREGVPPEHIATRGVGSNHPEHVDDIDARGRLFPEKAARSRPVVLTVES